MTIPTTESGLDIRPDLAGFRAAGATARLVPVHAEVLADAETPLSLYRKLTDGTPGSFLFESAEAGAWARYSFIGSAPVATLVSTSEGFRWEGTPPVGVPRTGGVLDAVAATLELLRIESSDLPPMVSSLVGYFGWDIIREVEKLGDPRPDEHRPPTVRLMIPGDIAVYDHYSGTLTLVANVVNVDGAETGIDDAYASGVARIEAMLARITAPAPRRGARAGSGDPAGAHPHPRARRTSKACAGPSRTSSTVRSSRSSSGGASTRTATPRRSWSTGCLRRANPSPFMYLLDLHDSDGQPVSIIGSSPEALVTVRQGTVVTHPIAGSRPRGASPEEDDRLARELLADEKERAEHLMLVDLARNDLAKVCRAGTIDVSAFMDIERFSHIMHISSTVRGELEDGHGAVDVLTATFPAGTLSGAPKPRALQIIDELEVVGRGLYGESSGTSPSPATSTSRSPSAPGSSATE